MPNHHFTTKTLNTAEQQQQPRLEDTNVRRPLDPSEEEQEEDEAGLRTPVAFISGLFRERDRMLRIIWCMGRDVNGLRRIGRGPIVNIFIGNWFKQ